MDLKSTIVAFATAQIESAIGVIRVSGPLSEGLAIQIFQKKEPIVSRKAIFGKYFSADGEKIDECVFLFFKGPASYTGEDILEISYHGNPFIGQKILKDLLNRGCVLATPGEFTRRAFLNGKMDLSQAEAVGNIIRARSDSALNMAQRLLEGELRDKIFSWNHSLLELLAEIEAQIDFSDEDLPMMGLDKMSHSLSLLIAELRNLESSSRYASSLNEGINVVILGAPNAGKSSLLNILLGENRALVSDIAGTTRDFVSEKTIMGEYCIRLMDTAGIRENPDSQIEKQGIEKTYQCAKTADLILFVVDSSTQSPDLPKEICSVISLKNTIIVLNKSDLPFCQENKNIFSEYQKVFISTTNVEAVAQIKETIREFLLKNLIVPNNEGIVVSVRQAEFIRAAVKQLERAKNDLGSVPIEFVANGLRDALNELSEILGRFDNEKVLDKVFSTFCIGK